MKIENENSYFIFYLGAFCFTVAFLTILFLVSPKINALEDKISSLQSSHNQTIDWIKAHSEERNISDTEILKCSFDMLTGNLKSCKLIRGFSQHFLIGTNISTEQFFGDDEK